VADTAALDTELTNALEPAGAPASDKLAGLLAELEDLATRGLVAMTGFKEADWEASQVNGPSEDIEAAAVYGVKPFFGIDGQPVVLGKGIVMYFRDEDGIQIPVTLRDNVYIVRWIPGQGVDVRKKRAGAPASETEPVESVGPEKEVFDVVIQEVGNAVTFRVLVPDEIFDVLPRNEQVDAVTTVREREFNVPGEPDTTKLLTVVIHPVSHVDETPNLRRIFGREKSPEPEKETAPAQRGPKRRSFPDIIKGLENNGLVKVPTRQEGLSRFFLNPDLVGPVTSSGDALRDQGTFALLAAEDVDQVSYLTRIVIASEKESIDIASYMSESNVEISPSLTKEPYINIKLRQPNGETSMDNINIREGDVFDVQLVDVEGTKTFFILVPDRVIEQITDEGKPELLEMDLTPYSEIPQKVKLVGESEAAAHPEKYPMFDYEGLEGEEPTKEINIPVHKPSERATNLDMLERMVAHLRELLKGRVDRVKVELEPETGDLPQPRFSSWDRGIVALILESLRFRGEFKQMEELTYHTFRHIKDEPFPDSMATARRFLDILLKAFDEAHKALGTADEITDESQIQPLINYMAIYQEQIDREALTRLFQEIFDSRTLEEKRDNRAAVQALLFPEEPVQDEAIAPLDTLRPINAINGDDTAVETVEEGAEWQYFDRASDMLDELHRQRVLDDRNYLLLYHLDDNHVELTSVGVNFQKMSEDYRAVWWVMKDNMDGVGLKLSYSSNTLRASPDVRDLMRVEEGKKITYAYRPNGIGGFELRLFITLSPEELEELATAGEQNIEAADGIPQSYGRWLRYEYDNVNILEVYLVGELTGAEKATVIIDRLRGGGYQDVSVTNPEILKTRGRPDGVFADMTTEEFNERFVILANQDYRYESEGVRKSILIVDTQTGKIANLEVEKKTPRGNAEMDSEIEAMMRLINSEDFFRAWFNENTNEIMFVEVDGGVTVINGYSHEIDDAPKSFGITEQHHRDHHPGFVPLWGVPEVRSMDTRETAEATETAAEEEPAEPVSETPDADEDETFAPLTPLGQDGVDLTRFLEMGSSPENFREAQEVIFKDTPYIAAPFTAGQMAFEYSFGDIRTTGGMEQGPKGYDTIATSHDNHFTLVAYLDSFQGGEELQFKLGQLGKDHLEILFGSRYVDPTRYPLSDGVTVKSATVVPEQYEQGEPFDAYKKRKLWINLSSIGEKEVAAFAAIRTGVHAFIPGAISNNDPRRLEIETDRTILIVEAVETATSKSLWIEDISESRGEETDEDPENRSELRTAGAVSDEVQSLSMSREEFVERERRFENRVFEQLRQGVIGRFKVGNGISDYDSIFNLRGENVLLRRIEKRAVEGNVVYVDLGPGEGNAMLDVIGAGIPGVQVYGQSLTPFDDARRGLDIRYADVLDLQFPNQSVDVLTTVFMTYHTGAPYETLGEISRVLKVGGEAFITFDRPQSAVISNEFGPDSEADLREELLRAAENDGGADLIEYDKDTYTIISPNFKIEVYLPGDWGILEDGLVVLDSKKRHPIIHLTRLNGEADLQFDLDLKEIRQYTAGRRGIEVVYERAPVTVPVIAAAEAVSAGQLVLAGVARHELRIAATAELLTVTRSLTASETEDALADIRFARDKGFLPEVADGELTRKVVEAALALAETALDEDEQRLLSRFSGRLEVVANPIKRLDDILWIHLDTDDILYSWTRDEQGPATALSEFSFHYHDKEALTLRRENDEGTEFDLVIRESLFNSIANAVTAGDERGQAALLTTLVEQAQEMEGDVSPGSSAETVAEARSEILSGSSQSVQYFTTQAQDFFAGLQTAPVQQLVRPVYLLVSTEVIKNNYGINRTIQILSSLGYRVFIRETDEFEDRNYAERFYEAYHLQELIDNAAVRTVRGNDAIVKAKIAQKVPTRLTRDNLISITFESEAGTSDVFSNLVLKDDVLGSRRASKRADFPVLLLAARLREAPELIVGEKLSEEIITSEGDNTWFLHQTPEGFDFTDFVSSELANYQAIAEALASAA